MSITEIRTLLKATPYRPFAIRLEDGNRAVVPHPEFLEIPAEGDSLIVHHADGSSLSIKTSAIAAVEPGAPRHEGFPGKS